jgi:ppGpp synthetase/RelA/SpoT-type nucleotidyltranferase
MDVDSIRREYLSKISTFTHLQGEALFILEPAIRDIHIKLHSISQRIKTVDSFLDKVQRKESEKPFEDIRDIVGIRVVCLFLSDIARIGGVIRNSFIVLEEDDKVEGTDASSFGYMSVHFIVMMKEEHSGPRYDPIAKLPFEIQVRTIAMDAWANVSHHLNYKSDKDVPSDLKRDFYALSGLFYVADKHFEMFYGASRQSQQEMAELFEEASPQTIAQQEINLDSLTAYLNTKFPDRNHADAKRISILISELSKVGYRTIGDIDRTVETAWDAFLLYEKENPPSTGEDRFADVGVVRISAQIVDEKYHRMSYFASDDYRDLSDEDEKDEIFTAERERYNKCRKLLKT